MKIFYSSHFARQYLKLPLDIQRQAEKKEKIFRKTPFDRQLRTHKLQGALKDFWSFSIDYQYRIVFRFGEKDEAYFHAVGNHTVYR